MALNTSGNPNTNDYVLGRGIIYLAKLDPATDLPDANGFRDLGNAPAFKVTVTTESLKHQSSRTGFKTTDVDVIISREISAVAFDLEEQNDQNIALFFMGNTNSAETNAAVAGFAEYQMIPAVKLGSWYQIKDSTGVRAYNITAANLTVEISGAPDTALVLGTDYLVNEEMGLIQFIHTPSVLVDDGDPIDVTLAAAAGAGNVDQVFGLVAEAATYAVMFIEENPIDSSAMKEWLFHKVQIAPTGDLEKIGDTIGKMSFAGGAQKCNAAIRADSPYVTVTDLAAA